MSCVCIVYIMLPCVCGWGDDLTNPTSTRSRAEQENTKRKGRANEPCLYVLCIWQVDGVPGITLPPERLSSSQAGVERNDATARLNATSAPCVRPEYQTRVDRSDGVNTCRTSA